MATVSYDARRSTRRIGLPIAAAVLLAGCSSGEEAGVDARLVWMDGEEHAFGPQFFDAMVRTARFFRAELA